MTYVHWCILKGCQMNKVVSYMSSYGIVVNIKIKYKIYIAQLQIARSYCITEQWLCNGYNMHEIKDLYLKQLTNNLLSWLSEFTATLLSKQSRFVSFKNVYINI